METEVLEKTNITKEIDQSKKTEKKSLLDYAKELAKRLDEETEDWTPEKAIQMVIANHFLPVDAVRESTEEILQPLRDKIALHQANLGAGVSAPAIEAKVPNAGQKALTALDEDDIDDLDD